LLSCVLLTTISTAVGEVQRVRFDLKDRPDQVVQAGGPTLTQTFDDLNRLLTRAVSGAGTESFGYSARGLIAYTNQLAHVTRFDYDAAARLLTITNANSDLVQIGYKLGSDFVDTYKGALANGGAIDDGFDTVGRLESTVFKNAGGTTLSSRTYVYNGAHQRTKETRSLADHGRTRANISRQGTCGSR
jgi:YD repeat-containing protein